MGEVGLGVGSEGQSPTQSASRCKSEVATRARIMATSEDKGDSTSKGTPP